MTTISLKYSSAVGNRPNPSTLADGELALNIAAATGSTAVYFKNASGGLVKVGPAAYQQTPPYDGGAYGNTKGELWFQSNTFLFKVYTGTEWVNAWPGTQLTGTTTQFATVLGTGANTDGTSIGVNAGQKGSIGVKAVWVGKNAGAGNNTKVAPTDGGVFIGYEAAYNATKVESSVLIGSQVAYNSATIEAAVSIGARCTQNSTSLGCVALGYEAMKNCAAGGKVAVGYKALTSLTTGADNVAVGATALSLVTTGSNNTALGDGAAFNLTGASSNNTFVGAGSYFTSGNANVVIGNNAGGETGSRNIIVGNTSGMSGDCNSAVFIGPTNFLSGATRQISIGIEATGVKLAFNPNGALVNRSGEPGGIGSPWLSNGTTLPAWGTAGVSGSFQLPAGTVTVKDGLVVSIG